MSTRNEAPAIIVLEMTDRDIEFAEKIAAELGYAQTAYTSTSELWGLFCLPDHADHKHGCVILTKQFGFMFVSDLEDLQLHDLAAKQRLHFNPSKSKADNTGRIA